MSVQSEQINELMGALAKAQGEFTHASKDTANPYFKSKYADLAAVWQACREPLSKNGLAVTQTMDIAGEKQVLITMLSHSSGQWIKSLMVIPVQKPGPQELGSCLSYCRRYALAALVGVYQDDDDAETAQKPYRSENGNGATAAAQNKAKQGLSADQRAKLDSLMAKIDDPDYIDQLEGYVENTLGAISIYEISSGDFTKIVKSLEKKITNTKEGANGAEGMAGVA